MELEKSYYVLGISTWGLKLMQGKAMRWMVIVFVFFLYACTSPSNRHAFYTSPYKYRDANCDEIGVAGIELNRKLGLSSGEVKKDNLKDVALISVSLIVPLALFAVGYNDVDNARYGMLRGEFEALKHASEEKGCNHNFEIGKQQ